MKKLTTEEIKKKIVTYLKQNEQAYYNEFGDGGGDEADQEELEALLSDKAWKRTRKAQGELVGECDWFQLTIYDNPGFTGDKCWIRDFESCSDFCEKYVSVYSNIDDTEIVRIIVKGSL